MEKKGPSLRKSTGKRSGNKGEFTRHQRQKNGAEEERKRERARVSQRNFHLRKKAKFDTLEQRINSLEDTIEQMSNEFIGFGDLVVAKSESTTKPLILDDLKATTARFLHLARAVESPADQGDDSSETSLTKKPRIEPLSNIQPGSINLRPDSPYDPFDFNAVFSAGTPSLVPRVVQQADPQARFQSYFQNSRAFSPRLDYGFFGTGTITPRPSHTPTSQTPWLTYVISGPSSFAMLLYIDTTVLLFNVLRGAESLPGFVPTILRFRLRHERPHTLLEKLRYQFEKMQIDVNDPESLILNADERGNHESGDESLILFGPSDYEMVDKLMLKVVEDYSQESDEALDEWFDPWTAQQYLSSELGLKFSSGKFTTSEKTLQGLDLPMEDVSSQAPEFEASEFKWWDISSSQPLSSRGGGSNFSRSSSGTPRSSKNILAISSQKLARKLTFHAMCFGEGPRYPKSGIKQAVRELLGEVYFL